MDNAQIKVMVRVEVFFGLFSIRYNYWIGDTCFTETPHDLKWVSEEEMQSRVILDLVGVPEGLKGEWKAVYDEDKEVVVEYLPTLEEAKEMAEEKRRHDETWEIALMCASLGD